MKAQRGGESGPGDNERVLRYLAKATINPAITHGLSGDVGSLQVGRLADLAMWLPHFFAVRPELVLKSGFPTWGASGSGNATTMMSQPTSVGPQVRRGRSGAGAALARLPGGLGDGRRAADRPARARRYETRAS